jgi:hypothetical protein
VRVQCFFVRSWVLGCFLATSVTRLNLIRNRRTAMVWLGLGERA